MRGEWKTGICSAGDGHKQAYYRAYRKGNHLITVTWDDDTSEEIGNIHETLTEKQGWKYRGDGYAL